MNLDGIKDWLAEREQDGAKSALMLVDDARLLVGEVERLHETLKASAELCNIREEQLRKELDEVERLRAALDTAWAALDKAYPLLSEMYDWNVAQPFVEAINKALELREAPRNVV